MGRTIHCDCEIVRCYLCSSQTTRKEALHFALPLSKPFVARDPALTQNHTPETLDTAPDPLVQEWHRSRVVETLGCCWTPVSLKTIKMTGRMTTVSSRLSLSNVIKSLHKQLSVRLWQLNATIILERLFMEARDIDFDII